MLLAFKQYFMEKIPDRIQLELIDVGEFSIQINSG